MKIEHFAYQAGDAAAVSEWYCEHLDFTVKRGSNDPFPVRFLADASGDVMIEIYSNPAVETPDYASMDPLILHMAFVCDDVSATAERLTGAGAALSSTETTPAGDELAMLRDPWGFAIQLCQRREPMVRSFPFSG